MSKRELTGKDMLIVFMVAMVGAFLVQLPVYYDADAERMAWPGISRIIENSFGGALLWVVPYQVIKMLEKDMIGE
jgi:hypothetical protein